MCPGVNGACVGSSIEVQKCETECHAEWGALSLWSQCVVHEEEGVVAWMGGMRSERMRGRRREWMGGGGLCPLVSLLYQRNPIDWLVGDDGSVRLSLVRFRNNRSVRQRECLEAAIVSLIVKFEAEFHR